MNLNNLEKYKEIYKYSPDKPMRVVFFVSGGGGNFNAGLELQKEFPSLISIELVVADRLQTRAVEIAKENGIAVIEEDFEGYCGIWKNVKDNLEDSLKYQQKAIEFHDNILDKIILFEKKNNIKFDLAVLSYRRWIHGKLFDYFKDRMINQHAGDLSILLPDGSRKYTGINPVYYALKDGQRYTRTSTFLVNNGHDSGEVLSQGFKVKFEGTEINLEIALKHELEQKQKSDWPSLKFALKEIALGNYGVSLDSFHLDGCRKIIHKNKELPYQGIDMEDLI